MPPRLMMWKRKMPKKMTDCVVNRASARGVFRLLGTLVVAMGLTLLGGCATATSTLDSSGVDDLLLHMRVTDSESMDAIYEVGQAHEIAFAGGRSAIKDATTWRGELTDEEFDQLMILLEDANWFRAGQAMVDGASARRYDIMVNAPGGEVQAKLDGDCSSAESVYLLLDHAARRRFDDVLDRRPKPSSQRPAQP